MALVADGLFWRRAIDPDFDCAALAPHVVAMLRSLVSPPAAAAPAKPAAPVAAPAKPAVATPVAKKTNLNTAPAEELDKLPQIGPARAKAIVDARAKGKFKNWDDFVARSVVPANAEAAIKDLVSF
jgi:DNA uptake protein ComE-like DNA-binding protein